MQTVASSMGEASHDLKANDSFWGLNFGGNSESAAGAIVDFQWTSETDALQPVSQERSRGMIEFKRSKLAAKGRH